MPKPNEHIGDWGRSFSLSVYVEVEMIANESDPITISRCYREYSKQQLNANGFKNQDYETLIMGFV